MNPFERRVQKGGGFPLLSAKRDFFYHPDESGYTLLELMVASAVGLLLFGAMMWIMVHTADMLGTSFATSEMLSEARAIVRMLHDGAYPDKTQTSNTWIPGAASCSTLDFTDSKSLVSDDTQSIQAGTKTWYFINNNRLYQMRDGNSIANTALPRFATPDRSRKVMCTGAGAPHPKCTAAGEITVSGLVESLSMNRKRWDNKGGFVDALFTLRHSSPLSNPMAGQHETQATTFATGMGLFNDTRPPVVVSITIPKTGQLTSYAAGDDGALKKGSAWPTPRFTDNLNGTVTDNLTRLVWLKNANCWGMQSWNNALNLSNTLASGSCGLSDGSVAGDWRLANINELITLVDYGLYFPSLPSGHSFSGVQSHYYWSSTTYLYNTVNAWFMYLHNGEVFTGNKPNTNYVWPVRGGQ
ncbi:MAG: DUF1566 domain-containing protein [Magnetococcales bacterium]|nr:DUF1566 domain-containing protein [Magnetococcales bacterium]